MSFAGFMSQFQGKEGPVKSVLHPLNWLILCFSGPVFLCVLYTKVSGFALWISLFAASIPLILLVFGFVFFSFKDPNRLQSEGFQIRRQELDIQEKEVGYLSDPISIEDEEAHNPN